MSGGAAEEWQAFCAAFADYSAGLNKVQSVHVNSADVKAATKQVAQRYIHRVRPHLLALNFGESVEGIDGAFQSLLELSEGRNLAASYKRHARAVRRTVTTLSGQIEYRLAGAVVDSSGPSKEDAKIIGILSGLVTSAASSYQQAIADLSDEKRVSFKGPAHELREVLREVLDHFAPNAEVVASAGFKFEDGLTKPTMRQKVRFILAARGRSRKGSEAPEDVTVTVETMIAELTRTVYNTGSAAAHVAQERALIVKLKRYVDVVLMDILEL
jgi:hypothetical protein